MPSALAPLLALVLFQDTPSPSHRHPADAQLYIELQTGAAMRAAYARTAYAHVLADPDLHAALGRLLGKDAPLDPLTFLWDQYDERVASGEIPPLSEVFLEPLGGVSASLSIRGGLAALVEELRSSEDESQAAGMALERLAVQFDLDYPDPEAAGRVEGFLEGLLQQGGDKVQVERVQAGDLHLTRVTADGGPFPLRYVRDGGHFSFWLSSGDEGEFLARLSDPSAEGPAPLAELPAAAKGAQPFLLLRNTLADELWQIPDAQPALIAVDMFEVLLGTPISMFLRGGEWRVSIDPDGRFQTEGVHGRVEASPFGRIFGSAVLDRDALSLVHPEAIVAEVTHLDKGALLQALGVVAERTGTDFLGEFEASTGIRLDRDLLEPLGPALAYSLPTPKSLLSAPPLSVAVALTDRPTFESGLVRLLEFVAAQEEVPITIEDSEYREARVLSLRFHIPDGLVQLPIPFDPSAFFRPTFVVMDGRFFATTQPTNAKAEIRRLVRSEVDIHTSLAQAQLPEGVTRVGFSDWTQYFAQLYGGARALANLASAGADAPLPFDLKALPEAEIVTRHFQPTLRWRRLVPGGMEQHESSSFGPEVALALPMLGVGSLLAVQQTTGGPLEVIEQVEVDGDGDGR